MSRSAIDSIKHALKLITNIDEGQKGDGLQILREVLHDKDKHLVELGYDQVIFKELMKIIQFDSGQILKLSLEILEDYYFGQKNLQDELAEIIIYRLARTNDSEISSLCLQSICSLVDRFDDGIAKHSKQLLKLADLNEDMALNNIYTQILLKMQDKLPIRRDEPLHAR